MRTRLFGFMPDLFKKKPSEISPPAKTDQADAPAPKAPTTINTSAPMAPVAKATHLGPVLAQRIEQARSRLDFKSEDPEYTITRDSFDLLFYLMRRRDMMKATRMDFVRHYLRAGHAEGRRPTNYFSPKLYVERYPDAKDAQMNLFAHWLSEGRARGEIVYPIKRFDELCKVLKVEPATAQEHLIDTHKSVRDRLADGKLGEMVAKAAELDPLIAHSWPAALEPKIAPFHSDAVVDRIVAMDDLQNQAGFRRAKYVLVLNRSRWGGGKRMEGYIAHALSHLCDTNDEIVVITTEETSEPVPGRFPPNVRFVDFARAGEPMGDEGRMRVLTEFLRSLRPQAVFNINSKTMWNAVQSYGAAMRHSFKVVNCMFCNEQTNVGFWTGYPIKRFYRIFDQSHAFAFDSHFLRDELSDRFLIPPQQMDKMNVLSAPVDPGIPLAEAPAQDRDRPVIFWAGRLDRQKRVDILFQIAEAMPDCDFRVWGESFMDRKNPLKVPGNVTLEGMFGAFNELKLDEADAWLYTSQWDGVPSILLEVSMTGLPIVGTRVGGTGEILIDSYTAPIDTVDDVQAYCDALRAVLADPAAARQRAKDLRDHLIETRTTQRYLADITKILDASDDRG